jgi:hypothetical protein
MGAPCWREAAEQSMRRFTRALSVAIIAISAQNGLVVQQGYAECYEKVPLRPVHRNYVYRDVEDPGLYPVTRIPAEYGWVEKKVYHPGEVIWHEEPPLYRTVHVKVRRPDGWATVEKQILVHRGRRWAERTPPTVTYVQRRILLRPYKNIVHYQPPHVVYSREHITAWVPARPDC